MKALSNEIIKSPDLLNAIRQTPIEVQKYIALLECKYKTNIDSINHLTYTVESLRTVEYLREKIPYDIEIYNRRITNLSLDIATLKKSLSKANRTISDLKSTIKSLRTDNFEGADMEEKSLEALDEHFRNDIYSEFED